MFFPLPFMMQECHPHAPKLPEEHKVKKSILKAFSALIKNSQEKEFDHIPEAIKKQVEALSDEALACRSRRKALEMEARVNAFAKEHDCEDYVDYVFINSGAGDRLGDLVENMPDDWPEDPLGVLERLRFTGPEELYEFHLEQCRKAGLI